MLRRKKIMSLILVFVITLSLIPQYQVNNVFAQGEESSDKEPEKVQYTVQTLEAAITNLSDAIDQVKTANSSLEEKINAYNTFFTEENEAKYTPASYNALKNDVEAAKTIKASADKAVTTAEAALTKIKADYDEAKKKAEADAGNDPKDITEQEPQTGEPEIPAETIEAIQKEAESALKELDCDGQLKTISNKITTMQGYNDALLEQANKETLAASIKKAKEKIKDNYFAEEYDAMVLLIPEMQKVCDDKNATKAEVTAANKKLTNAIKALRVIYKTSGDTRIYNIYNFCAYSDDTVDDTDAIQDALDTASEKYKIEINFQSGTYHLSKSLYIQSNTSLKLKSDTVIIRDDSALGANMIKNTDSKHKLSTAGNYDLSHDIVIDGGTWDGGNISKSTKECNLLYFGHANGIYINNTSIKNCHGSHALEFAGVNNATVNNCTFTNFRYGSNSYTSEAIQMDICWKSDAEGSWAPGYKQDKTSCKNIKITNNTIIDYPRGIGSHHYLSSNPYTDITIKDNTITRSSAAAQSKCITGIFLTGIKNADVNNNTVDSYYYGIWIKLSSGLKVQNNILKYNAYYNILYDGNNVANKKVRFVFVSVKKKKVGNVKNPKAKQKKLYFTASTIKKGYVKIGKQKYTIKKSKKYFPVTLKKKLKKKQKIEMYGTDKDNNKIYRIYYAS